MSERVSQTGSAISKAGQTHSMEMIFFPLFVLIITGAIANNFSSFGIQTTPTLPTPFCQQVAICYPLNTNGCDNAKSNCNFTSSTSFSFLNANSPFTLLLQGNIIGFMSNIFAQAEIPNTFQIGETICVPQISNGSTPVLANQTGQNIHLLQCFGQVAYNDVQAPNVFPRLNASSNNGNNSIWNLVGCPNPNVEICTNGVSADNHYQQSSFYGFYIKNGTILTASSNCNLFGTALNCLKSLANIFDNGANPTFQCPNTNHIAGANINKTTYYCLIPVVGGSSAPNLNNTLSFMAFIFGIILLIMGLGLQIAISVVATGVTLGINEQGAKLAQVFGLAIAIWSFIYSEFGSTWIPSLPLNLSVIAFVSLTGTFFLGLYWRLFSLD